MRVFGTFPFLIQLLILTCVYLKSTLRLLLVNQVELLLMGSC